MSARAAIDAADGLFVTGHDLPGVTAFAGLFGQVWTTVPFDDRSAMLAHWRHLGFDQAAGGYNIPVFLEAFRETRKGRCAGRYESHGAVFRFYGPLMAVAPPQHVKALIAHELAHALQASRGQPLRAEPSAQMKVVFGDELAQDIAYACSPVEDEADEIATAWGFEQGSSKSWMHHDVDWARFEAVDVY